VYLLGKRNKKEKTERNEQEDGDGLGGIETEVASINYPLL